MAENLIFSLILVPQNIFAGFASTRCYTFWQALIVYNFIETNEPTWDSFRPDFGPNSPNSGCQFFFFNNLAWSVTRYHDQLSLCTNIRKKTMIQSWENLVIDRPAGTRRGRWSDGHVNESDLIGHCLTNIQHPTKITILFILS